MNLIIEKKNFFWHIMSHMSGSHIYDITWKLMEGMENIYMHDH